MARIRNVKIGLYKNEDLLEVEITARYIFPGLWCLADREGRLEDRPKRIKMELMPAENCDMEDLLAQLARAGVILRYEVDGQRFIQIVKFLIHQRPHKKEAPSVIPAPPGFVPPAPTAESDLGDDEPGKDRCSPGKGDDEPGGILDLGYGILEEGDRTGAHDGATSSPLDAFEDLGQGAPVPGLPKGNGHPFSEEQLARIQAAMPPGQTFDPRGMALKIRHEIEKYVGRGELQVECIGAWRSLSPEQQVDWFVEGVRRAMVENCKPVWRLAFAGKQIGRALENGIDLLQDGWAPRGKVVAIGTAPSAPKTPQEKMLADLNKPRSSGLTDVEWVKECCRYWAGRFGAHIDPTEPLRLFEAEGLEPALLAIGERCVELSRSQQRTAE